MGLKITTRAQGSKIHMDTTVKAQEYDEEHPEEFLLMVLWVLHGQGLIFIRLNEANPEIAHAVLLERKIPAFRAGVAAMFRRMGKLRPDLNMQKDLA